VKYWEIIANRLMKAGWSLGWVSAADAQGRTIWIVDAHRVTESVTLCARAKSSARLLNLKESAANHCAFQMSNNSAQFSPCSLLPALLLASALNPRKRISQN
jgi:hypothetical protein